MIKSNYIKITDVMRANLTLKRADSLTEGDVIVREDWGRPVISSVFDYEDLDLWLFFSKDDYLCCESDTVFEVLKPMSKLPKNKKEKK